MLSPDPSTCPHPQLIKNPWSHPSVAQLSELPPIGSHESTYSTHPSSICRPPKYFLCPPASPGSVQTTTKPVICQMTDVAIYPHTCTHIATRMCAHTQHAYTCTLNTYFADAFRLKVKTLKKVSTYLSSLILGQMPCSLSPSGPWRSWLSLPGPAATPGFPAPVDLRYLFHREPFPTSSGPLCIF